MAELFASFFLWMTRTIVPCIANIMVDDFLMIQGVKALVPKEMTYLSWNMLIKSWMNF